MVDVELAVAAVLAANPVTIVLSVPSQKPPPYRQVRFSAVNGAWQAEKLTDTQVFHETVPSAAMQEMLCGMLGQSFGQLTAFAQQTEYAVRVTKKGKVLTSKRAVAGQPKPEVQKGHNRTKNYLLAEGAPIAPLVDMGVFTAEGKVVQAMYDKYRQINRFVELVDDALKNREPASLHVIDFGCGKSYLTFVLYHYLVHIRKLKVEMTGLDLKKDVVQKCSEAARRYGYDGLHFEVGDIAAYKPQKQVDMVVTLHACDTATDLALAHAVEWGAPLIFSVPCCQHELNAQMQSEAFAILTRYGIVKERIAALFTDAIRANLLTTCGYKTQLVEFVGFEHTPKNIMIRAQKTGLPTAVKQKAYREVLQLTEEFALRPSLLELLQQKGLPGFTASPE